eukprot:5474772-Pleurochrysis_carterae.AAC.5
MRSKASLRGIIGIRLVLVLAFLPKSATFKRRQHRFDAIKSMQLGKVIQFCVYNSLRARRVELVQHFSRGAVAASFIQHAVEIPLLVKSRPTSYPREHL